MIARTLNEDRRHLSAEQRREIVAALRQDGHSIRGIAGALGISSKTAQKDIGDKVNPGTTPDRVEGQDGKSYPARRTVVAAKDPREAERAAAESRKGVIAPTEAPVDRPSTYVACRLAYRELADSLRPALLPVEELS